MPILDNKSIIGNNLRNKFRIIQDAVETDRNKGCKD